MVTANPLFTGGKSVTDKLLATVITDIWPEVLFFTSIAAMVALVSKLTAHSLAMSNQMLTVLGTVVGLVISFRTSTAYERFSEGRKLWTNIAIASRNLAQIIWIHVPTDRTDKETSEKIPILKVVIEKKSMINLVQAYSVSVKHLLRGESGVYYADLYPLISLLPRFSTNPDHATEDDMLPLWKASNMDHEAHMTLRSMTLVQDSPPLSDSPVQERMSEKETHEGKSWFHSGRSRHRTFDPEAALSLLPSERPLLPARNPPKWSFYDYFGLLRIFRPITRPFSKRLSMGFHLSHEDTLGDHLPIRRRTLLGKKVRPEAADSNVPVEIALFLSTYFSWLMRQTLLTPASATAMVNAITNLQDSVVNLERIKTTPLPFAYQAHLRMSLWIFLFLLPFQIYSAFGWLTIPATSFASFLFVGFLEIGQEIENPFDYDLNGLDLDHFCLAIQRELHEVTAHPCQDPDSYIFSDWNQPFAPADRHSAKEMLDDVQHPYHAADSSEHHIRRTLLRSWQSVDEVTRK